MEFPAPPNSDAAERNQVSRRLRIWSAGCSIGAEPYSVAILLKQNLAQRMADWDITIVATDINRQFLARAREGLFEEWAFRTNSEDFKRTWFLPAGKAWRISPELKDGISFQYHNLVKHPYPSLVNNLFAFDVILCRNVSIYFNQDIVRKILDGFYHCLVEGGWLLVGHAEPNTDLFRSFRAVNAPGAVLYQKTMLPEAPSSQREQEQLLPLLALRADTGGDERSLPAPSTATADLALIRALADRGEWEKAQTACARLLQEDKLNPKVHFYLALLQEQGGRHPEAEASLRRTLYLDRHFVLAHYYLGLIHQKTRETKKAARSFQNALQILSPLDEAHAFADADGITVADLKQLTRMHLQVLEDS